MEPQTLYDMFAAASSVHSGRTAVTFDSGSGSPESLRYKDLATLSSELCGILQLKCQPNTGVIGLYCRNDVLLPVWLLGIMQSPAAYVPLDPAAPGLMSTRVIKRCGLLYCVVQTELLERFQESLAKFLSMDVCALLPKFKLTVLKVTSLQDTEQNKQTTSQTVDDEAAVCDSSAELKDTLAYVLHTSGTTGLPKIVRVPHKCIRPNIEFLRLLLQMNKEDVVFLASPLTFDPSVVEIFLALSSGAQLLIVPTLLKKMPKRLAQLLFKSHKTTILQATPTLVCRFGSHSLKEDVLSPSSSLRALILGGEPCVSPALLSQWKHKDNKTEIFNIYGITEVSCWATCCRVSESLLESNQTMSTVPLGFPVMGTIVEVRDDHGALVTQGDGQVFIGGEDRVCLLDDEKRIVPGTMRASGDWVNVKDGRLYFLGRRDRLIKRHGQRVNLDCLPQLISAAPLVETCAVGLHENYRLLAFIVTSASKNRKASPVCVCDAPVSERQEDEGAADVSRAVLQQLSQVLASHCVPDTVVIVPEIPLTPHGKVDMKALMKIYQTYRNGLRGISSQRNFTTLKSTLESLWQATLGLPKDVPINEDSNFLLSGGDSLRALVLYEDILTATGLTSPALLEVILDGTFADTLHHVTEIQLVSLPDQNVRPEAKKRHLQQNLQEVQTKRERQMSKREMFKVFKRASQVLGMHRDESIFQHVQKMENEGLKNISNDVSLQMRLSWSSDTGRCVDASPVILVQRSGKSTVFVGSHSHRIQALDLDSGSVVWERVLGDRIEASATISHCGTLVIVGCYDGCVYFLSVSSGETEWTFETGNAVKCCPAVDAETGVVFVGSHDGHVYALDPEARQCVWKHHCGGAVFSSPYIHPSLRHVYVASFGGHFLCLNPDSGEVLWSYTKDSPFFSSPVSSETHTVIGSADKNICSFSVTGELQWQFLTQGPVFSSPCLTPDQQQVVCGSHDGHLYCLNSSDGSLVWTFETTGKVYSSPYVFDGSALGTERSLVALASTDGTVWILDANTGRRLASHTLPGELFSSPVIYKDSLVIGCRNDYVYCLKLSPMETNCVQ